MLPENLIGFYIKHKQAKDVCYYVNKISKVNANYLYDLTIFNMGFEKSWKLDKCKVENIDLNNFVYYTDEAKCFRNVEWKSITAGEK